ncbi:hypothetical protein ACTJK9_01355 [Pseudomonas sp. 22082]|uniref:hypothetical protein n=1 Tax=Pseudomonas sp. 22082 TaxID=3453868 RepID=UPI003F82AD3E
MSNSNITLAQRLREYNHNSHHINPMSEAFHTLIDDAADALSVSDLTEDVLNIAYWDFDARVKGHAPYCAPCGSPSHAFKTAIFAAIESVKLRGRP